VPYDDLHCSKSRNGQQRIHLSKNGTRVNHQGAGTMTISGRSAPTILQISLHNLSQNWNQYIMSATWHSLLLNVYNPVIIGHLLRNCIGQESGARSGDTKSTTHKRSQDSQEGAPPSTTLDDEELMDVSPRTQLCTKAQGTKTYLWLFDTLEHLIELLCCGCLGHCCIGMVKSMPQLIYGMNLGVHQWMFDSKDSLVKIINAYKSQYISLKDTLRPVLRITIDLEDKYKNAGLNVKYQEKELASILQLCQSHGMSLYGVVIELPSTVVGTTQAPNLQQSNKSSSRIAQLRRGFRYLEIVCDECVKANLTKPGMIFVRSMGCPPPDDVFSVHSESSRFEVNQRIEDALCQATGRSSIHPTTDIEAWLQPLQEMTHLSKQWKEIDPDHYIRVVADPSQFLQSNTHSLSVRIMSVSKKTFWKAKKVHFLFTQSGASIESLQVVKSKSKFTLYQEVHLSEGVAFLFSMKLRGITLKPYLETVTGEAEDEKQNPSANQQPINIIPTIIYGDSSHCDPGDCLNPIQSATSDGEPIFFGLPLLTEEDKLRFEGLGMFEHLFARSGLLDFRAHQYATMYISSAKRSRL